MTYERVGWLRGSGGQGFFGIGRVGGPGGCGLGGRGLGGVLLAEGVVDLEQHLLLPLVDRGVGEDDGPRLELVLRLLVENPGPYVERLGGDPQGLRDLLQHLGAGLPQPALDLTQIRIRHPGGVGELPQGQLRGPPLLAEVLAEIADVERCHAPTMPAFANYCKHPLAAARGAACRQVSLSTVGVVFARHLSSSAAGLLVQVLLGRPPRDSEKRCCQWALPGCASWANWWSMSTIRSCAGGDGQPPVGRPGGLAAPGRRDGVS